MSKVAGSRISVPIVVVSEITTGDHSERADCCERSRFRASQRVLSIAIANDLALSVSRQVEVAREDIARILSLARLAVAIGPSFIVTMPGIRFCLLVRDRAATDARPGVIVPIVAVAKISPLT